MEVEGQRSAKRQDDTIGIHSYQAGVDKVGYERFRGLKEASAGVVRVSGVRGQGAAVFDLIGAITGADQATVEGGSESHDYLGKVAYYSLKNHKPQSANYSRPSTYWEELRPIQGPTSSCRDRSIGVNEGQYRLPLAASQVKKGSSYPNSPPLPRQHSQRPRLLARSLLRL